MKNKTVEDKKYIIILGRSLRIFYWYQIYFEMRYRK